MSLITTASPWIHTNTNENKKRVPSIRRNQKRDDESNYTEPMKNMKAPPSMKRWKKQITNETIRLMIY